MEELLNEMRQDINKLPAQLANQSSVTQKLQLSDNNILTRLTTGIPSIQAGKQNAPTIQVLSRTRDRTEVPPSNVWGRGSEVSCKYSQSIGRCLEFGEFVSRNF